MEITPVDVRSFHLQVELINLTILGSCSSFSSGLHILKNLKNNSDPSYENIRAGIPPIQNMAGTFEFIGSR